MVNTYVAFLLIALFSYLGEVGQFQIKFQKSHPIQFIRSHTLYCHAFIFTQTKEKKTNNTLE